jgi:hypothetical protein
VNLGDGDQIMDVARIIPEDEDAAGEALEGLEGVEGIEGPEATAEIEGDELESVESEGDA